MSLPKRDGVHGRYYLIHKPDTAPEVLEQADQCIQDVLDGTAKENHSGYPVVVRNQNGTPFLPSQLLERYLSKLPLKGFPCEEAVTFCDALRRLAGWKEIDHTLRQYIEKQVRDRYFEVGEKEDYFSVYPPCTVWPELRPEDVDEGLLRFACYVAVCYTVYGASYDSLTTEHILGLVSQLRPDMVKQLKRAAAANCQRTSSGVRRSISPHRPMMRLPPSASPPGTPPRSAMLKSWTTCARCWSRRNFPAVTRWSSVGRRRFTCPFPACPKRSQSALCLRCAAPQSASSYGAIRSFGYAGV